MGRMYTAVFKDQAVAAAQDLFEVLAATAKPVVVHGFVLGQTSELADAAEEQLRLTTNRGVGAVTSGNGTGVTAQPVDDVDTAFGGTIERNATTIMAAGSGSIEELEVHVWNVRAPYVHWYTPETRPKIAPGNRWTLELESTPADSIQMSGTLYLEEL